MSKRHRPTPNANLCELPGCECPAAMLVTIISSGERIRRVGCYDHAMEAATYLRHHGEPCMTEPVALRIKDRRPIYWPLQVKPHL